MRRLRAFTLIELLVTITIIVILAALLLPALALAQERGRRARCLSNVRQIGMIFGHYADDHQGAFPDLVDCTKEPGFPVPAVDLDGKPSKWPARTAFANLMRQRYLNDPRVLICPSSQDKMTMGTKRLDFDEVYLIYLVPGEDQCSYGWDPTKSAGSSSTVALVADKPWTEDHLEGERYGNSLNHRRNGQNVFFNDGHTEWRDTPDPDVGTDMDFYKGDEGYEKSFTDAKIIR